MKAVILILFMSFSSTIYSQKPNVSDYVEGGKVLLEFVKLFNPIRKT